MSAGAPISTGSYTFISHPGLTCFSEAQVERFAGLLEAAAEEIESGTAWLLAKDCAAAAEVLRQATFNTVIPPPAYTVPYA